MPRDPSCPLSHCPVGKSSGCFPITPEIQPCIPLRPQGCPLPSPHPPTASFYSPTGWAPPSQPRKDIFEKAFPNLLPNIRAILSSLPFAPCHYLELLFLFYLVPLCPPPPNRSSRKPGDLVQLNLAAASRPTGLVLQIIKGK